MIISSCCGCDRNCTFSHKRFSIGTGSTDPPEHTLRETLPHPATIHCAKNGRTLVGDRVYNSDGTLRYKVPPVPEVGALWLWISDEDSLVSLYAVKSTIGNSETEEGVIRTLMKVWRWDEIDDSVTEIISLDQSIRGSVGPLTRTVLGAGGFHGWGRLWEPNYPTPGSFENFPSTKWGDVRHGRIVIVGNACWYNDASDTSDYQHNAVVRCWTLEGHYSWQADIAQFYGSQYQGEPVNDYSDGRPYGSALGLWGSASWLGYPKTLRVRIGEDKGVYVLTKHSRVPSQYGFHGRLNYLPQSGDIIQPCLWKIADDVTSSVPLEVSNRPYFGKSDGISYEAIKHFKFFDDGLQEEVDDLVAPYLTALPTGVDSEGNFHSQLLWTNATGGTPPYTYDVLVNDPGAEVYLDVLNNSYLHGPINWAIPISYKIRVTDSEARVAHSNTASTEYEESLHKIASARDMDVSSVGNVFISLITSDGQGLIKIVQDPSEGEFPPVDTPDTTWRRGFSLNETDHKYIYAETTSEFAGPIWSDNGVVPEDPPVYPTVSDEVTCWVLRAGDDGTYLRKITLTSNDPPVYSASRHWACGFYPFLRIERSIRSVVADVDIFTSTDGNLVGDAEPPCPPCNPPEDDPCSLCANKTYKKAWKVPLDFDTPEKAAAFGGTRTLNCMVKCGIFGLTNDPLKFTHNEEEDCSWLLCGARLVSCPSSLVNTGLYDPNCEEYMGPSPQEPSVKCCNITPYSPVTLGTSHSGNPEASEDFLLIFWTLNWAAYDLDGSIDVIVWAKYKAEEKSQICGPTATFIKIEDNSQGEIGSEWEGLFDLFPERLYGERIVMETPCDIPEPTPTNPWCPGNGEPVTEELCFGVDAYTEAGGEVHSIEFPPPETDPPKIVFDGTNAWIQGSFKITMDCSFWPGVVPYVYNVDFDLFISDVNDPSATWTGEINWSGGATDQPPNSGTFNLSLTGYSCPPLTMEWDTGLDWDDEFIGCTSLFSIVNYALRIHVFLCPEPSSKKAFSVKLTPKDLPCIHRGSYLTTNSCCGELYQCKSKDVPEKACAINKTATPGVAVCDGCQFRQEKKES